jgi:hypothetical protein
VTRVARSPPDDRRQKPGEVSATSPPKHPARQRGRVVLEVERADREAHLVLARDPEAERRGRVVVVGAGPLEAVAGLEAERRADRGAVLVGRDVDRDRPELEAVGVVDDGSGRRADDVDRAVDADRSR